VFFTNSNNFGTASYPYTSVYESLYIYNKQFTGNNELDALTMIYVM